MLDRCQPGQGLGFEGGGGAVECEGDVGGEGGSEGGRARCGAGPAASQPAVLQPPGHLPPSSHPILPLCAFKSPAKVALIWTFI